MPEPRPLPVVFFRTEAGREPVREWLKDLAPAERGIKKRQKTPPEDKALALKRKHAHSKTEKE